MNDSELQELQSRYLPSTLGLFGVPETTYTPSSEIFGAGVLSFFYVQRRCLWGLLMLCDRDDGGYNETHEQAGTELGRMRRSPLPGVVCRPGLSASVEFNTLLKLDFPLPPVL